MTKKSSIDIYNTIINIFAGDNPVKKCPYCDSDNLLVTPDSGICLSTNINPRPMLGLPSSIFPHLNQYPERYYNYTISNVCNNCKETTRVTVSIEYKVSIFNNEMEWNIHKISISDIYGHVRLD